VTIAPQCWASVAAHFDVGGVECAGRLVSFFKSLGATLVLDLNVARDVALLEVGPPPPFDVFEMAEEFGERVSRGGPFPFLVSACPG
jgi:iron only hydrogenase large subunit-like protein